MLLLIRRRKLRTLIVFIVAVVAVKYISVLAGLLTDVDQSPQSPKVADDEFVDRRKNDGEPGRRSSKHRPRHVFNDLPTPIVDADGGKDGSTLDGWSVDNLLTMLGDRWQFWWIRQRIQRTWTEVEAAALALRAGKRCSNWTSVKRRKVMILPGLLTLTNFARPEVIRRGGALGELTQWADLIAACFALCHSLAVRYHIRGAVHELRLEMSDSTSLQVSHQESTGCDSDYVDVIYTDIAALHKLPPDVRLAYRWRLRVLDAFGTEPMFNDPEYIQLHPELSEKVGWGGLGLRPKQFNTLYPHTPDNSFLGFIVLNAFNAATEKQTAKENYALIMGKKSEYIEHQVKALHIIHKFLPLRLTIQPYATLQQQLPSSTHYYGVVSSAEYQTIVAEAKLCVGLGDPVESPSVLEALANGCVFLNPRRRSDEVAFKDKPTGRLVTSQVPYLERFVGPPRVFTVNYDNVDELQQLLINITNKDAQPAVGAFIPREFTALGFLERLDAYLTYQDFCSPSSSSSRSGSSNSSRWPPLSALRVVSSGRGQSCGDACYDQGFVCEPDFFRVINDVSYFTRTNTSVSHCRHVRRVAEPYVPAFIASNDVSENQLGATCLLQARAELFSCAEGHPDRGVRICPCRDFIRNQLALCKDCASRSETPIT